MDIRSVGIVGAGQMGNGIAHVAAQAGSARGWPTASSGSLTPGVHMHAFVGSAGATRASSRLLISFVAVFGLATIGGPQTVRQRLEQLLEQTEADELIFTCDMYDFADRLHAFDILAELQHS